MDFDSVAAKGKGGSPPEQAMLGNGPEHRHLKTTDSEITRNEQKCVLRPCLHQRNILAKCLKRRCKRKHYPYPPFEYQKCTKAP